MDKHAVVHFEIYGEDPEKLAQFHTSLFGWTIDPVPAIDYMFIQTVPSDDKGMPTRPGSINGGLMKRPLPEARFWVNYVNVESVEASLEQAQRLGATVARGKSAVPGMGWFAIVTDPQGNTFGLWQVDPSAA